MKKLNVNFILATDSYKNNHAEYLKDGVVYMEGNIVARKPNATTAHVVMSGAQYAIQEMLDITLTMEDIDEAEIEITEQGLPFDRSKWEYIVTQYKGKIPLQIRALPEGTVTPVGCPLVRVMTTDPKCVFLQSYVETFLQRAVWYCTSVASIARSIKVLLRETMLRHAGHENVQFHLHNFGDRGAAGAFDVSILAGMSHGLLFDGSDCLSANRYIKAYYNTKKPYLSSVEATEHSVTCSNSDADNRDDFNMAVKTVRHWEKKVDLFNQTGKGIPVMSVVIDTYDAERFAREYIGTRLRDTIKEIGKKGGRLVLRPDSGDPVKMPIKIIEILMEKFGYTINEQGYKVLPSYIGVIQGDGIEYNSIKEIISVLDQKKISLENIVFGMGGKLVHPTGGRDMFSFAMKATSQTLENGVKEDLFKDPITDIGKQSLRGEVTTFKCTQSGKIFHDRVSLLDVNPFIEDMMVDMYINGDILNLSNYDDARTRANI